MKKMNWSFREALEHVRKKRWVVNPNPGFVRQLKRYETKLRKPINNPEMSQSERFEDKIFSQTSKYPSKMETSENKGQKYGLSSFVAKSSVMRGKSVVEPKNNSRLYQFSVAKR
jgi:hypothetical protein